MYRTERRFARAFTLAEALVYGSLGVVLLGVLYSLFLPVVGIASASVAKVDSESPAAAAIYQLEADIRVSGGKAVTVGTLAAVPQSALGSAAETTVLAIPSFVHFSGGTDLHGQYYYDPTTGGPLWRSYIIWVLTANGDGISTLYRTTLNLAQPYSGAAQAISASQLTPVVTNISSSGRIMARSVTSFQVALVTLPPPCGGCMQVPKPEIELQIGSKNLDQHGQSSTSIFRTQIFARDG